MGAVGTATVGMLDDDCPDAGSEFIGGCVCEVEVAAPVVLYGDWDAAAGLLEV